MEQARGRHTLLKRLFLVLLAAAGLLAPFWPFAAIGVALAAAGGFPALALALGLILDLAWGAPGGIAGFVPLPFTLLALLFMVVRRLSKRYMLESLGELRVY